MSLQQILESTKLTSLTAEPKYLVILHNDDYTTSEFVIEVLVKFFNHDLTEANEIMLKIQYEGSGVGGIYNFEIAETKAYQAMKHAQKYGFPFKCTLESVS
ncbi:ATP-dependent Clp protease adaptor ClpS [Orbaceae bacterium ac157xtp]